MKIRRCKQCGELLPEDQFRPYYKRDGSGGRSTSRYRVCLQCERINTRYKYLTRKIVEGKAEHKDTTELQRIATLYDILRQRGLEPPNSRAAEAPLDIDAEIRKHTEELERKKSDAALPEELQFWLDEDLSKYSPEDLEDVTDELLSQFRPEVGVDPETYLPVYDTTYRDALNEIIKRFDDYEDSLD